MSAVDRARETAINAILLVPISLFFGGAAYLLDLPFLVLAFDSPFYHERLRQIFIKDDVRHDPDQWYRHLDDTPLSTEPTHKPVKADVVVGCWHFYLDGESKTVIIDFRPNGTFTQTICPNQGGIQHCPGGTWRLEGANVYLDGYVAAADGASRQQAWWMIDAPSGELALFGGDGQDRKSYFRMRRTTALV